MSKRVLITGASSGIGAASVEEMRRHGAQVAGLDINAEGEVIACDVRDQESVNSAVAEAVERLGGLDVVINNAGVGHAQSAGAPPDETAEALIQINLMGPWRVTGAAMPHLLESRGRVVNVASGLAHLTIPFATAYCMSKRGVVAYSEALRLEYGDAISVTTVYPGYIRTPIHDASAETGLRLEGAIPAEQLSDAARTLSRAALGPPIRDLATTKQGTVNYALASRAPRRLMERLVRMRLRQLARKGHFDSSGAAAEMVARLRA